MIVKLYNNLNIFKKTKAGVIDILPRVQFEWVVSSIDDTTTITLVFAWLFFESNVIFYLKNK